MRIIVSTALYNYLRDYYNWATIKPITDENPRICSQYNKATGLCANAERYCHSKYQSLKVVREKARELNQELQMLFKLQGLDGLYPFGERNYEDRYYNGNNYQCKLRQEWIKCVLDMYEDYKRISE